MPGGDVSIQASLHPSGLWITVPVMLGGLHTLTMVLDSGSPASAVSPETADELRSLNLLGQAHDARYDYRFTRLTVEGQPLPDIEVRIFRRLTRLRIAGLVGLDFLSKFVWIHFHVPTLRLVLEDP